MGDHNITISVRPHADPTLLENLRALAAMARDAGLKVTVVGDLEDVRYGRRAAQPRVVIIDRNEVEI